MRWTDPAEKNATNKTSKARVQERKVQETKEQVRKGGYPRCLTFNYPDGLSWATSGGKPPFLIVIPDRSNVTRPLKIVCDDDVWIIGRNTRRPATNIPS